MEAYSLLVLGIFVELLGKLFNNILGIWSYFIQIEYISLLMLHFHLIL